jgi:PHS family inorganic phosphate transporter-like MFS transporter
LVAAALVGFIITAAYKSALLKETDITHLHSVDFMWRLLIGLGCVPGVVALYFRLTIPETPRFTMDIERNIDQATNDIKNVLTNNPANVDPDLFIQRIDTPKASWADFAAHFGQLKNFKILFGTAYSWFALDVRLLHALLSPRLAS